VEAKQVFIKTQIEETSVEVQKEISADEVIPIKVSTKVALTAEIETSFQSQDTIGQGKPKRALPRSSAIGSMFKEIHKEYVAEEDSYKIELTQETVEVLWEDFLKENKDKLQNAFLNAAKGQLPQLIEDKVTFIATNNVSLEMLQLHKMDITTFFRKRTTSTTVSPDFILLRDEQVKNYQTPKDRLKEMIDANPAVLTLIQKFDLNMD